MKETNDQKLWHLSASKVRQARLNRNRSQRASIVIMYWTVIATNNSHVNYVTMIWISINSIVTLSSFFLTICKLLYWFYLQQQQNNERLFLKSSIRQILHPLAHRHHPRQNLDRFFIIVSLPVLRFASAVRQVVGSFILWSRLHLSQIPSVFYGFKIGEIKNKRSLWWWTSFYCFDDSPCCVLSSSSLSSLSFVS